ncbi:MAG TPA: tetratricopeptide repeat protein [Bryobacteraceae bacterium]|nr:tetratricopeptide repeat protein [Bryobacteraceae bacterium]
MCPKMSASRSFAALVLLLTPLLTASDDSNGDASYQRGRAAFDAGKYTQAIPPLKAALEKAHATSRTGFTLVQSAYTLALVYQLHGQPTMAEPLYVEAKAAVEAMGDSGRPLLGFVLESLGELRFDQGSWNESEKLQQQAITICTETHGKNHICTLTAQRHLGELMIERGSFADAESVFEDLIRTLRQMPAPPAEFLASSLASFATLQISEARFETAEPLLRESMDLLSSNRISGPILADTLIDLGRLYRLEHNCARGEPLLKKALDIYENGNDPHQAGALNELGLLALDEQKFAVAKQYLNRSLDVYQKIAGSTRLLAGRVKAALAEAFLGERNVEQARTLIHDALTIEREALGDQHSEYARQLIVAANVEASCHRTADAETYYRQALTIFRRSFSEDQPERIGAERKYAQFVQSVRK